MLVAPSMLSCDFSKLGEETSRIDNAGADLIHLDVMDGLFVPNITIGPCVVESIRKYTSLPFDVHLMIQNPIDFVKQFADAGADIISFHIESSSDTQETINKIKSFNVKPAIAIKPATDPEILFNYLDDLYMVLVMTVEPGFGGQKFMNDMMKKVQTIKSECKRRNLDVLVEVDGGINESTAKISEENGVDICVAGTSVFKAENPAEAIRTLKCRKGCSI